MTEEYTIRIKVQGVQDAAQRIKKVLAGQGIDPDEGGGLRTCLRTLGCGEALQFDVLKSHWNTVDADRLVKDLEEVGLPGIFEESELQLDD